VASPIRVLIVDDSIVVRRLVKDVIGEDPEIDVVGTAATGKIGLAKILQVKPDLVTLDIEMPDMDGLTALKKIVAEHPDLPVVMFSTLTEEDASVTLEALAIGASDCVTKPNGTGGLSASKQAVRDVLLPKIKALCGRSAGTSQTGEAAASIGSPGLTVGSRVLTVTPEVLAIGVSTGGPKALSALVPRLPADLPVPVLIVQHMPPLFTKLLAERLSDRSPMSVREAEPGAKLDPGVVWIAPGDYHMFVERGAGGVVIRLNQEVPENSCRPSVDQLFRSVADVYGPAVLAAVLTGMGRDGLEGCERVRKAGGYVVVQDQSSSVVWGMPGAVARAGLADRVLDLDSLGAELPRLISPRARLVRHGGT